MLDYKRYLSGMVLMLLQELRRERNRRWLIYLEEPIID